MRDRAFQAVILATVGVALGWPPAAPAQTSTSAASTKPTDPARKILVELYTSQGCNSCPPASDLLGSLTQLGYGPDRVVALNFHVDYFNTPWADPFSDPAFSDRQLSYNQVLKRNDLYFTPLMMVDGRYSLLGSNREQAVASIRRAKAEPAAVNLGLALEGDGPRKRLAVRVTAKNPDVAGRDLLIAVALTEDRVATKVPSGENAGKTLVEYHVVRRLDHQFTKPDRLEPTTLTFPVALPPGSDPARFHVSVFAQDRVNGKVHQADAIPWASARSSPEAALRVAKP